MLVTVSVVEMVLVSVCVVWDVLWLVVLVMVWLVPVTVAVAEDVLV